MPALCGDTCGGRTNSGMGGLTLLLAQVLSPGAQVLASLPRMSLTQPKGPVGVMLQPLPIVANLFERLGIDIVEPLPKVAGRHKPIFISIDYTTLYPEAAALCSTTALVTARE